MTEIDLRNLSKLEKEYQAAVKEHPTIHNQFLLGKIYQKQHRYQLAEKMYKQVLSQERLPECLLRYGEMSFDRKQYDKALPLLLEVSQTTDETWQFTELVDQLIETIYAYDTC